MKSISHTDLMVLVDTDMQDELQALIDMPTTAGILVLHDNMLFAPYGPTHPITNRSQAACLWPQPNFIYEKETSNAHHHNQDRKEIRPDADLPGVPEGDAVQQARRPADPDDGSDRGHQGTRIRGAGSAVALRAVSKREWIEHLMRLCPLMALASSSGRLRFCDRSGRILAVYDPTSGAHYLAA